MTKKSKILIAICIPLILVAAAACILLTGTVPCGKSSKDGSLWIGRSNYAEQGIMYLCGESHNKDVIMAEELRIWYDLYHNEGMRHFFLENAYYDAQLLNRWMQSDNDELLWMNWEKIKASKNSKADNDGTLIFYRFIKEYCPETVFHGTDIGHKYNTTGEWYLELLKNEGKEDTEEYRLTMEAIEQGQKYYNNGNKDHEYRETKMHENFMREYEKLNGLSIFGVYGAAHVQYPVTVTGRLVNSPNMVTRIYLEMGDEKLVADVLNHPIRLKELTVKLSDLGIDPFPDGQN